MSDHSGLRYLFQQPNLNENKARCLTTVSEFYFEIRYIKGKENNVVDSLIRIVLLNHIGAMISYGTNL